MAKLAHLLEKLASAAESASLEKQAKNAHELIMALRNAAVKTNTGLQPNALPKMLHNLDKRNAAVKKVLPSRMQRLLDADKKFADLAAGGEGIPQGSLIKAFKERAIAGNRIPQDVFQYEKSPAGVIDSIDALKKLETMKYPVNSAY